MMETMISIPLDSLEAMQRWRKEREGGGSEGGREEVSKGWKRERERGGGGGTGGRYRKREGK